MHFSAQISSLSISITMKVRVNQDENEMTQIAVVPESVSKSLWKCYGTQC